MVDIYDHGLLFVCVCVFGHKQNKNQKTDPWKGTFSSFGSEWALKSLWLLCDSYWVGHFRSHYSGKHHFEEGIVFMFMWDVWNFQGLRTVSVSHLVSGEAEIQAQISLMIHFSGACGLVKTWLHWVLMADRFWAGWRGDGVTTLGSIMKLKALDWLVISYHTSPGHNFQQGIWVPGWSRAGKNFCNLLAEHELAALLFGNCLGPLMFPKERVQVQNWMNMKVQMKGKWIKLMGPFFGSYLELAPYSFSPSQTTILCSINFAHYWDLMGRGWGAYWIRCSSSVLLK